jgi:long-chain acyl-CoA synthetase
MFRRTPEGPVESRTYRRFLDDIEALGTGLVGLGLQGCRVAVIGENRYEWAVSHSAVVNGVGVSVPLDRMLPENEVSNLLVRGDAEAILYAPSFHDMMLSIAKQNKRIRHFLCMDGAAVADLLPKDDGRFGSLQEVLSAGAAALASGNRVFVDAKIDPDVMCALLFTSGTTAMSKGVMQSQRNVCSNVYSVSGVILIEPGERALSVLPLHHTFENTVGMNMMLYYGVCICFTDGLRYFAKNLAEWKIQILLAVPLLYENIYHKLMDGIKKSGKEKLVGILRKVTRFLRIFGIDVRRKVFHSVLEGLGGNMRLCVSGAAPIDARIIRALDDFGILFLQGYGLTETSPVATACNEKVNILGSIGHPVSEVEVAIDTESVEPGAIGEILVRGPNVMLGYYENPEASAEVLMPDGWLRTGDMGCFDKHGCIYVTGRIKSMIVMANGKKAFPEEIEALLNRIEGVKESLAWGENEATGGVDICARLVVDAEKLAALAASDDAKAQIDWLWAQVRSVNAEMPGYRAIKYLLVSTKDLVKTTTLKIKRPAEAERLKKLLATHGLTVRALSGKNIDALLD